VHGHGDGGDGVLGGEGARECLRTMQHGLVIITRVTARQGETGWLGRCPSPCSTAAEDGDDGDGERAWEREGACLAASWCRGECACERRERGED
jgi:hypothetical protein